MSYLYSKTPYIILQHMKENITSIQITKDLRRELCSIGSKGKTYQEIITNLVKEKKSQTLAEEPEIPAPKKEVISTAP